MDPGSALRLARVTRREFGGARCAGPADTELLPPLKPLRRTAIFPRNLALAHSAPWIDTGTGVATDTVIVTGVTLPAAAK